VCEGIDPIDLVINLELVLDFHWVEGFTTASLVSIWLGGRSEAEG